MSNLDIEGLGQAGLIFPETNVNIKLRDAKTNKIIKEIDKHNRVTRLPLFTLLRIINGEFTQCDRTTVITNPLFRLSNFVPSYIAFGHGNKAVDINDMALEDEIDSPRMWISKSRTIQNFYESNYITIVFKHFVPMSTYVGMTLSEAGLFCTETGDSLFARITFDPIEKDDSTVIDITWSITIQIIETHDAPYYPLDKTELKEAINNFLIYFAERFPEYAKVMEELKKAIDGYYDMTTQQDTIDQLTINLLQAVEEAGL